MWEENFSHPERLSLSKLSAVPDDKMGAGLIAFESSGKLSFMKIVRKAHSFPQ